MSTLPLDDAKAYLNISGTTHDTELQDFIDAAEAVITNRCGPLESDEATARITGGGYALVLPTMPAIALTSVTDSSESAVILDDLNLDADSGVVTYNSGAAFSASYYTVVYDTGREECPADLLMAVKELVRHLWATQRSTNVRGGVNDVPGASHILPFRVVELIAPHTRYGVA